MNITKNRLKSNLFHLLPINVFFAYLFDITEGSRKISPEENGMANGKSSRNADPDQTLRFIKKKRELGRNPNTLLIDCEFVCKVAGILYKKICKIYKAERCNFYFFGCVY